MRFKTIACLATVLLVVGCSTTDNPTPPASPAPAATQATRPAVAVDARDIAGHYESLTLMTGRPVQVGAGMIALCAPAASPGGSAARYGPHAGGSIRIFMNDLAAGAFARHATPFPVGSVIVKEKQPRTFGVGGMIKRPPGYDPEHGDWEYFYLDDPATIDSGKLTSCAQCHERAAKTDYVFGEWASPGNEE